MCAGRVCCRLGGKLGGRVVGRVCDRVAGMVCGRVAGRVCGRVGGRMCGRLGDRVRGGQGHCGGSSGFGCFGRGCRCCHLNSPMSLGADMGVSVWGTWRLEPITEPVLTEI